VFDKSLKIDYLTI